MMEPRSTSGESDIQGNLDGSWSACDVAGAEQGERLSPSSVKARRPSRELATARDAMRGEGLSAADDDRVAVVPVACHEECGRPLDELPMKDRPLASRHILVPASRAGQNVLADLLAKKGAKVTVFPSVEVVAPWDLEPLDSAMKQIGTFDWLIISGAASVVRLAERLREQGRPPLAELSCAICAVGVGAASELRNLGRAPDVAPREHTPEAIAQSLAHPNQNRLLLVREATASDDLLTYLREQGADVTAVAAYRARLVATYTQARRAFKYRPDLLALASPTAVRYFVRAATDVNLDVKRCLGGVTVAAVGVTTAEEAERHGLNPDLVSCGRLSALVRDMISLYGRNR